MCQPDIPALFKVPALLGVGLLSRVSVVPRDFTGTIESSGTIQPALSGDPHSTAKIVPHTFQVGGMQFEKVKLTTLPLMCRVPIELYRYGGYALSFTLALGLGANVSSTYLMVAGGYLLLIAGAVGAWAASSIRPDAFRIHFGALLPAGVLYFSLTIVQLARVGPSNRHVEEAWDTLNPGDDLYITQAKVRTTLIVGGVLSAATFALIVAAAVASWAARRTLLRLPGGSFGAGWKGRPRLSRGETLAATWALALAATSTFFDGSFAVFSAWLARDREQAVWLVAFWRAMGRGDRRYVEGDTFVVATAIIVAAVIGPGALLYAWSVYCRKGFRFSVGILVCAASLHTQLLRYVTSAENSKSDSVSETGSDSDSDSGSKAFFIAASVILALLQVAGALAVLMYNIRRMTKRVHAAEVQYRALLLEHDRLSLKGSSGSSTNDGNGGGNGSTSGSSGGGGSGSRGSSSHGSNTGSGVVNGKGVIGSGMSCSGDVSGSGGVSGTGGITGTGDIIGTGGIRDSGGGGLDSRDLRKEQEEEERVTCYPALERQADLGAWSKEDKPTRLRLRR